MADKSKVEEYYDQCRKKSYNHRLEPQTIADIIGQLHQGKSPGVDGVTSEHLKHGLSPTLCDILAELYSTLLCRGCVPSVFCTGLIVPILKKSTLNPNLAKHYRPVTLSSIHTKILEMTLIPSHPISDTQYGFREGRGTGMACSLLNDIIMQCKDQHSPLFLSSLDAEKCFDMVCHVSLFVKLKDVLPMYQWLFLYRWYSNLNAMVKWNGQFSVLFNVTRGTRQGSVLSPYLFNIFLNDLLLQLKRVYSGVIVGNTLYNSFAYADDVSIFCTNARGLQRLIDTCYEYSSRWRFRFNKEKSMCMIIGNCPLVDEPKWYMHDTELNNVNRMEVLGTVFNSGGTCTEHVDSRIKKCRQSFYGLSPAGMIYPGATTDVQSYLFKRICQPTLT